MNDYWNTFRSEIEEARKNNLKAQSDKNARKVILKGIIDWFKNKSAASFWHPTTQDMEELRANMKLAGYIHTRDGGEWYTKAQLRQGSSEITCTYYGLQDFVTAEYWKLSQ